MKSSKARGKILMGIDRLARDYPFHSSILSRWQLLEDCNVTKTLAIGFRQGRLTLVFNPDFVLPLNLDQLSGVLCHEVNHLLLGHLDESAKQNITNKAARILSEEISSNEWVSPLLQLPYSPPLLEHFPFLSPNQSTDERYEILKNIIPADAISDSVDDHALWDEVKDGGNLAKAVTASTVAQAMNNLSPEQKLKLPKQIRLIGEQAEAEVLKLSKGNGKLDWRIILRRYVGRMLHRRPSFNKPPRRFPELCGVIPSRARCGSKPKCLCCLDCSGSMSKDLLEMVSGELTRLSRTHQIILAEFDTKVHRIENPFQPPLKEVHGRGGTSFKCLFGELLKSQRPDAMCIFTDGYGDAPDNKPPIPVLWILTPNGKKPCNWGRSIQM